MEKKSKYIYIGPFFKLGHVQNGKTYNPDTMTDQEIEQFIKENEFASDWWKTSKPDKEEK